MYEEGHVFQLTNFKMFSEINGNGGKGGGGAVPTITNVLVGLLQKFWSQNLKSWILTPLNTS